MEQSLGARRRATPGDETSKVDQAKDQAQEKVKEGAGKVRDRLREQADQRSTQAGEQVRSAGGDARSVAEQLRQQGKDRPARYAEQAADRADRLGDYLRDADGDRILRDVEDFARRNPWAAAAGGVALGFAASRMLKASSGERYRQSAAPRSLPAGGPSRPQDSGMAP